MEPAAQSSPELILSTKKCAERVRSVFLRIGASHSAVDSGGSSFGRSAHIAQLIESPGDGTLCTIWLPHDDGKQLYCAAAHSLPGFIADAGLMTIGPKGDPAAQLSIGRKRSM
jgi:formate hydrogenlyase transcriptional activator